MDCLHEELTMGFKIIMDGTVFPAEFQAGDRLSIYNNLPEEDCRYVLLKTHGKHEVVIFQEQKYDPSRCSVIGTIVSYERSCDADNVLFLGDITDYTPEPATCSGCEFLEIVEMVGKAVPCCLTSSGLVECTSGRARKCTRR